MIGQTKKQTNKQTNRDYNFINIDALLEIWCPDLNESKRDCEHKMKLVMQKW